MAIERALEANRKFAVAGQVLWAAGFEVEDRFWRDRLRRADATTRRLSRIVSAVQTRDGDGPTLGERSLRLGPFPGVMGRISKRLRKPQLERLMNVGADIVAGSFEGYDLSAAEHEAFTTEDVAKSAFELGEGDRHRVFGSGLVLAPLLENALVEISKSLDEPDAAEFSDHEISAARDDVRNALRTTVCMHEALAWIYGPHAFNLRLGAWLGRNMPTAAIYNLTLGFARLRRRSNQWLSSDQIASLAFQAEATWLISNYLREAQGRDPQIQKIINPDRLKLAFSDSHEHGKFLKELESYDFPSPDFRPWAEWQKLSKRTMSRGLLVMSIGAPNQVSAEVIQRVATGAQNP